ncbi:hypothetical protein M2451_004159, partial [Dysgonomonas sp. PFB1-18]|uniref:hypothetical protein n=1 Tax=unclassified Dysgonomonas TaxID=2630389 RepID=UPI002476B44C
MRRNIIFILIIAFVYSGFAFSQNRYELNSGWKCLPSGKTKDTGEKISTASYPVSKWQPAVVPGTVLATQLANKE